MAKSPDNATVETIADRSHVCDACGGSGRLGSCSPACVSDYHSVACNLYGCAICHGIGRISDVMPVADALADAETLREIWTTLYDYLCWRDHRLGPIIRLLDQTPHTHFAGELCRDLYCGSPREHARAAFRAVPGLRGE